MTNVILLGFARLPPRAVSLAERAGAQAHAEAQDGLRSAGEGDPGGW